ncbi:MAG: sensor domain-containing diguanylate cyclase [Alicyclobacillaceae bacterium]|nr:sensor domain-containing diguanylate cyclase [Alicyclobacillaceae bacterium]
MTRQFPQRATIYAWVVAFAGLSSGAFFVPGLFHPWWFITIGLVAVAALLEHLPVPIGSILTSLVMAVPLGAVVAYRPETAIWVPALASFVAAIFFGKRKSSWYIIAFNVGQYLLSSLVLVGIFYLVVPHHPSGVSLNLSVILGMVAAGIGFVVANHLFLNGMQKFMDRFDGTLALTLFKADMLNLLIVFPFSLAMVLLRPIQSWLTVVALLPLVVLSYTLRNIRTLRDMQTVHTTAIRLASEFDLEAIGRETASAVRKLCSADEVVVFQIHPDSRRLLPLAVEPEEDEDQFSSLGWPEEEGGVIWEVIDSREPVYVQDTRKDSRVVWTGTDGIRFLSMVIVPLHSRAAVQGAIVLYSKRSYAFSESIQYATALGAHVSVLIENARLYQELLSRSARDGATGLYNYRHFYEVLHRRMKWAQESETALSVAIIDIDFFKKFNDTYGHLAGDAVLKSVGELLRDLAGEDALVARYGGEEFGVILPLPTALALERIEQMRSAIMHHQVEFDGYQLQGITVSAGVANYPEHSSTDRELLLRADSAMYWGAKQRGRNRSAVYAPEFDHPLNIDALTGLYTYHFANNRVAEELELGVRQWGVVCMDIASFGAVNASIGFSEGTQVLKDVAMRLRDVVRQGELACRYGGDEFLVLVPNVGEEELGTISDRIVKALTTSSYVVSGNVALRLQVHVRFAAFAELTRTSDLFDETGQLFMALSSHRESSSSSLA